MPSFYGILAHVLVHSFETDGANVQTEFLVSTTNVQSFCCTNNPPDLDLQMVLGYHEILANQQGQQVQADHCDHLSQQGQKDRKDPKTGTKNKASTQYASDAIMTKKNFLHHVQLHQGHHLHQRNQWDQMGHEHLRDQQCQQNEQLYVLMKHKKITEEQIIRNEEKSSKQKDINLTNIEKCSGELTAAPVSPDGPFSPLKPGGPAMPVSPVRPIGPVSPRGPRIPSLPAGPGGPDGPGIHELQQHLVDLMGHGFPEGLQDQQHRFHLVHHVHPEGSRLFNNIIHTQYLHLDLLVLGIRYFQVHLVDQLGQLDQGDHQVQLDPAGRKVHTLHTHVYTLAPGAPGNPEGPVPPIGPCKIKDKSKWLNIYKNLSKLMDAYTLTCPAPFFP
ncbi:hypothetical protein L345_10668, partial [Ophiophagus hannah]